MLIMEESLVLDFFWRSKYLTFDYRISRNDIFVRNKEIFNKAGFKDKSHISGVINLMAERGLLFSPKKDGKDRANSVYFPNSCRKRALEEGFIPPV
jgi:hypothetical protein